MTDNLMPLDDFNNQRQHQYFVRKDEPNGIACPDCGKEMFDTDPSSIMASNPPMMQVACQCGYTGYRVA